MVAVAMLVPKNRDDVAVVEDVVHAEPIPLSLGDERIDLQGAVGTRAQTRKTRDHQIVEGRVVVVAGTLLIAFEPVARHLVEVLADVGTTAVVHRLDIEFHVAEIALGRYHGVALRVEVVGQSGQRLRRGEGPNRTIPLAFADTTGAEFGVATLGSCQAIGGIESLLIVDLQPGVFVTLLGDVEIPRNVADGLTRTTERVRTTGLEEGTPVVPEFSEDELLNLFGFLLVGGCILLLAHQTGHPGQCLGIAIHVAVDGRTGKLLLAAATDRLLHTILHIALPIEPVGQAVGLLPPLVFGLHVGIEVCEIGLVHVDQIAVVDGRGVPRTELGHLDHWFSLVATIPGVDNLVEVLLVVQPAALVDVVADGAGNQVVFVRVGTLHEELGHAVTHRGLLDVFAQAPPAEVEELLEVVLRALEEGNVLLHPGRRGTVRNRLYDVLVLHRVEPLGVVGEILVFEDGRGVVYVTRRGAEIGDAEGSLGGTRIASREVVKLVSPGVYRRVMATCSGAEYHALDGLHGGIKHACRAFLTVDIDGRVAILQGNFNLHVVGFPRLIGQHTTIAGTALRAHLALVGQVDAGASRTFVIHELDFEMSRMVLVGHQVELDGQFAGMRNLTLDFCIEEGVFILQREPLAVKRHGGPHRRVDVPHRQVG